MSPNYPACYVILRKEDKILFVLREHTGFMDGFYSLPAGRVEEGETFLAGACREAAEEVGVELESDQLRHVHTQHRYTSASGTKQWVDVFFDVDEWSGEPRNGEPDKHSRIEWLPIDDLPDNIMDYQRQALLGIAQGQTYGEFGWN